MRISWIVVVALLLAAPGAAHADAATEAWLGTWSGKLKAKGCADAPRKVRLEIAVGSDGVLRSSGDVLIEGLGDLDWRAGGKKLDGSREGLTVTFARSTKKKAKLAVRTDGGCRITGTLTRIKKGTAPPAVAVVTASGTGVSACDAYAAQIQRAINCPAMSAARDTYKQAYEQWLAAFSQMDPAGKAAVAEACKAAAEGLDQALTASGC